MGQQRFVTIKRNLKKKPKTTKKNKTKARKTCEMKQILHMHLFLTVFFVGATYYDYYNSTSKRATQVQLFPLLLNSTVPFERGNKAMRFTRTLADRQNNVRVPSISTPVPIKNILNVVALLNNLSLSNLLGTLLNGASIGIWVNWQYAPNNTYPASKYETPKQKRKKKRKNLTSTCCCSLPGATAGTFTMTISKKATVLGLTVDLTVASVTAPLSPTAAFGPPAARDWFQVQTNVLFNLLTLPDILDFTISVDMIGDVFVDAASLTLQLL